MSGQQKGNWGGKKRSKSYYLKCAKQKKFKRNVLEVDMKGFLVTCNSHEDQAVRECYNLLNEYADKLYGPEQLTGDKTTVDIDKDADSDKGAESEEEDIEKALQKEVTALKQTKPSERRFQRLDCSTKNCLFIKANVDDPSELGHKILSDIAETQVLKSRYALRLLPVQVTCKAFVDEILQTAEKLLEPHFRVPFGESRTFSVLFKSRNNNSVSREKVVPQIGQLIKEMNPLNSCDYHTPDRVVLVEIVCKICCLGVVQDFYKLKKYNLHEVAYPNVGKETSEGNDKGSETVVKSISGEAENPDVSKETSEGIEKGCETAVKSVSGEAENPDVSKETFDGIDKGCETSVKSVSSEPENPDVGKGAPAEASENASAAEDSCNQGISVDQDEQKGETINAIENSEPIPEKEIKLTEIGAGLGEK